MLLVTDIDRMFLLYPTSISCDLNKLLTVLLAMVKRLSKYSILLDFILLNLKVVTSFFLEIEAFFLVSLNVSLHLLDFVR